MQSVVINNARKLHETAFAVLYDLDGVHIWIPKSQIHSQGSILEVSKWWADKNLVLENV